MPEVALGAFADRICEVMPVIFREFARHLSEEFYKNRITLPQFLILEFLHREEQAKMTELARFMNVSTAAMTGMIERLVRDNYAQREYDPQDRRIVKIKLTPRGLLLVKKINQERRLVTMKIFGKISQEERSGYLRALLSLKEVLQKEKEENKPHD